MMEGYKNVLTDGLPDEDGSYLIVLKGDVSTPRLIVLYTQPDGSRLLVSVNGTKIEEDKISMYKRILITPDKRSQG